MRWLIIILFCVTQLFGASDEVFVNPSTGSDSNAGTEGAPYLNIQKGIENVNAGGTVWLRGGTYDQTGILIDSAAELPSGPSAGNPTKILGYPSEVALVRLTSGSSTVQLGNTSTQSRTNVLLGDFYVSGSRQSSSSAHYGIWFRSGQNIVVSNLYFTNFYLSCTALLAFGNRHESVGVYGGKVTYCTFNDFMNGSTVVAIPHVFYGDWISNVELTYNTISDTGAYDYPASYAFHLSSSTYAPTGPWGTNNTVAFNNIDVSIGGIAIAGAMRAYNKIYNNRIRTTSVQTPAMLLTSGANTNEIDFNSCYGGKYSIWIQEYGTVYRNKLRNNIWWNSIGTNVVVNTSVGEINYFTNNIMNVVPADGSGIQVFNGTIYSDPLFTSAPLDLSLTSLSPAKQAGVYLAGVLTDFLGVTRPNPPSIGAYDFPTALPPEQATSPNPPSGYGNVGTMSTLSWTAGANADSHDVYFGSSSPPASIGNQAGTTYDPGEMEPNTTYYWRVDEVNTYGTTTGVEWSFTTNPGGTSTGTINSLEVGTITVGH